MAKETIRSPRFRQEKLERLAKIVEIVEEFQAQGIVMSARQAYYQFVARGLIANTEREYQKFTSDLTDARYAGLVDWNAIEDRYIDKAKMDAVKAREEADKELLRKAVAGIMRKR